MKYSQNYRWKMGFVLSSAIFVFVAAAVTAMTAGPSFVSSRVLNSGERVYSENCARCHGNDGKARTAKGRQVGAVDLTSDEWSPNEARDTRIVSKGKGSMPAFKNRLTADEIASVVAYIRKFKS